MEEICTVIFRKLHKMSKELKVRSELSSRKTKTTQRNQLELQAMKNRAFVSTKLKNFFRRKNSTVSNVLAVMDVGHSSALQTFPFSC